MSFYSNLAATSSKLLTSKGQTVRLTRIEAGVYNPDTSTVENTETDYTAKAVLLDYKLQEKGISNDAGTLIQTGDKKLLVSPLDTSGAALPAFQPNDKALVNGETWTVVNAKAVSPAGTIVLQELQLRK